MDSRIELARQLISDISYRRGVSPNTSDLGDAETLANYVAHTATHVSRAAVNNRWCLDSQRAAFLAHHAAVAPTCRDIVRSALAGLTIAAAAQLAILLREADAVAPGRRPAA